MPLTTAPVRMALVRTTLRHVADAGPLRITYLLRRAAFLRAVLVLAAAFAVSPTLTGCAASAAEVKRANNSGYNTDFSTVYGEALAAVVKLYPRTAENAVDGLISTAWHRVAVQTGRGNRNQQNQALAGQTPQAQSLTSTAAASRKLYFIRFRVHVVGGKPWRVRVTGEASVISAGDHPMPLRGAETPPWLKGRIDALRVAIHRRLKKHAVTVEREIPKAEGTIITIDEPTGFGDIPKGAEEMLMELHRGLSLRSMPDIRAQLAEDVQ